MPRLLTVATAGAVSLGAGLGMVPGAAADPLADEQLTVSVDIVGDSYMAGEGLRDTYIDPADPRHRSTAAPALQALSRVQSDNSRLRVDANLVAASGAETRDFFFAQTGQDNTVVNPPQHDQVRPDSQLVIVGFGGADAQLATVLAEARRTTSGPNTELDKAIRDLGPLLDWTASDEDYIAQAKSSAPGEAPTLVARMVQVLAGVMARAPQAKIVVTTYPLAADPENGQAASLVGEDELTSVRKFGYDLNKAIDRAARICGCGTLVDLSGAVAGHEIYTADSAYNEQTDQQEAFQPNDKGASLIANPIANSIASLLQITAPEPSDGRMTVPKNIDIRDGVPDRDGDTVADSRDQAPDDPARATHEPDTGRETSPHQGSKSKHSNDPHQPHGGLLQPIAQLVDGLTDRAPADPAGDNRNPGMAESRPPARDQSMPTEPTAVAPERAAAPPVPGEDDSSDSRDQDVDTVTFATDTVAADVSGDAPTMGPNVVTVADTQTISAPAPSPASTQSKNMPSVDVPGFSLPGKFGDQPNRDVTINQLGLANEAAQYNGTNPVTVDTTGSLSGKLGISKFTDKTNQSAKVTRNADGTVDLQVTRLDGFNVDLGVPKVAGVGKYANQQMEGLGYKLSPESTKNWDANKTLPDYDSMLPGDTITRTPPLSEARAREWAAALNIGPGKAVEAQFDGRYSEGPALQYSVTALGDGRYSVAFGEASSSRARIGASTSLGDIAKKLSLPFGESIKGSVALDKGTSDFKNGAEVVYDTNTPEGAEGFNSAVTGLRQGMTPAIKPGDFYSSLTENKGEQTTTVGAKLSGKSVPSMPEAESRFTLNRFGDVTKTTTLMRSQDGTFLNGEPIGYSMMETTRLGQYTVSTMTDGNLRANTVTFLANGQKYTLSEGDMVQRAREMAETDPDTVKGNPVLSDLAAGIGLRPALLSGPPVSDEEGNTPTVYNDALRALVTPPDPEHNPFTTPPVPEHNPFTTPPVPEHNPFTTPPVPERNPLATPPLPERRADDLTVDPDLQQAAFDEPGFDSTDSLDGEAPADGVFTGTVVTPPGPAVPGFYTASARSLAQNDPTYDDATISVDDSPAAGWSDTVSADAPGESTSQTETSVDTDTTPSDSETSPGSDSSADSESTADSESSTDTSESVSTSDSTSSESASDSSDGGYGGGDSATSYGGGSGVSGSDSATSSSGDSGDSASDSATSSYGGGSGDSSGSASSSYGGSDSGDSGSDSASSSYGGSSGDSGSDSASSSYGGGSSYGGSDSSGSSSGDGGSSSGDGGSSSSSSGDGGSSSSSSGDGGSSSSSSSDGGSSSSSGGDGGSSSSGGGSSSGE